MAKIKKNQTSHKPKKVVKKYKQKTKPGNIKKTKKITQEFESVPINDTDLNNVEESSNSELLNSDNDENNILSDLEDEPVENDSDNESEDEAKKHKRDLEKLKESDPEFYKFLQENDKKLLDFNLSDEGSDDDEQEDKDVKSVHKPSDTLDVASDESDFEDEGDEKPKDESVITLKMLKKWQSEIQTDKSNKTITTLTQAFHAALFTISSREEDDEPSHYKVEGSAVFNGVIQLCVLELGPAIRKFLGLQHGWKQPPHKCKKFIKIKRSLKFYFTDLLKLLLCVTSSNIQTVLLKHLHYMSTLLVSYPNITKSLIKRLITLWATADDAVRVIAFFCILRITNNQQGSILDTVLKSMYLAYVKNSKFVSLNGLAAINFMRRSLVEMFALDTNVSYQHVFLYIRQLAIHLRNAITVNKKENIQSVYNWQFINSLRLWGNLLTVAYNKTHMQQLVYPFVQICLGTVKLIPTAQYYPLRFHVVQILIDLGRDTGVFIPVLPFLLEVLTSYDFNKKHQKVSMKPLHFTCLLRLSKSQLQENGFKDTVIETIYGQLLEYLTAQSHSIAFPDLTLLCVIQIKQFLKKCKNSNYNRKLKQVLEKIEQNCQFIESQRAKTTFNITDFKQIEGWETQLKNKGTPLAAYFESWNKLRTVKKNKQLTNNDQLGDYKLPTINKFKRRESKKSDGKVELFPSDSEDESEENKNKKPRRGKRGGKKINKRIVDESGPVDDGGQRDIVEDIKMDDW
ncbi:nucleolar complex protein 2 homolog [Anoplophora glabripennis]|uniref:nucleolar complex protein 2 homolog n=1 Tax=Anoplophora glabripennis TaxID=217634 RepID=UPI0008750D7A|nr:nucleolar complex protein 2 homolog [Anoplophora glabripennis]